MYVIIILMSINGCYCCNKIEEIKIYCKKCNCKYCDKCLNECKKYDDNPECFCVLEHKNICEKDMKCYYCKKDGCKYCLVEVCCDCCVLFCEECKRDVVGGCDCYSDSD